MSELDVEANYDFEVDPTSVDDVAMFGIPGVDIVGVGTNDNTNSADTSLGLPLTIEEADAWLQASGLTAPTHRDTPQFTYIHGNSDEC